MAGSLIWVAPSAEENSSGRRSTDSTSACLSTSQNPGPSGQPSTGISGTQATGAVPAQPGQRLERHAGHVGGRVEDDLGVRRPPRSRRHHSRPRNSSMEVASDTGDSNIG